MAKDFSDPHKLGFMRLIQVLFAINVLFTIIGLTTLARESYVLDFADTISLFNLVFDAISFWLIWNRKRAARYFIVAFSLLNIVAGTIYSIVVSEFSVVAQFSASLTDVILIAYFLTSRRAKAILVQPFNNETEKAHLDENANLYQPKTWAFWRNIIIYFCVFSVVGHWMEAGYCTFIRFGLIPGDYDPTSLIWTEWLYPFCVYGVGAVFCVLLFFPVKNFLLKHFNGIVSLVLSFVISGVVCSLIELAMGLVLNQPNAEGVYPLWDYSTMFCNFMGQICLQNGLAFGLAATLMTWVIYPVAEQLLHRLSNSTMMIVFIVTTVLFCVLFFFYCINIVIPNYADDAELDNSEACAFDVGEAGVRDAGALDSSAAFAWDARTSGGSETYMWNAGAPDGSGALLAIAL